MAEGQNVPELGGYDYEFTGKVPDNYNCLVCYLPMKDPVQIVGCGHRLCNICIESLLRRPSPFCPADRQPLSRDKIFPDAAFHREILDLTVKCSHFGCPWTGELRAVEKHQSECLLKVVECPNSGCTEKFTKQDMNVHVVLECSWRKINCEYCQESFVFNQKQKHFDVCQKFPVQCTNKCGLREIPREKLEVHIRDECPKTDVTCEYKNLGCEAVFPRSDADSHSKLQVERHLNLALRSLEATQFQVHDLVSLVMDLSQQIERLKIVNNTNDSFVWKISNFQALLDRAWTEEKVVKLSEPFYLSKNGYKLRLIFSLWKFRSLFGDSVFFSLNIRVVPGEFDPLLSWPFTEKVCVTVIDQNPCKDKRENILKVIDFEKKSDPCPRPLAEKDDFDYGDFLYTQLKSLKSRSYIMNNTIFIIASKE